MIYLALTNKHFSAILHKDSYTTHGGIMAKTEEKVEVNFLRAALLGTIGGLLFLRFLHHLIVVLQ